MVDGSSNDGSSTVTVMFLTFLSPDGFNMDNSTLYLVMIPFLPLLDGMDHSSRACLDLTSLAVELSGATEGTAGGDMNRCE